MVIFGDLSLIFGGFGRVFGKIWEVLSINFCLIFKKGDFVKIELPPRRELDF